MLRTYKYIETNHQKLHDSIMSFFEGIEFEDKEFEDFFEKDFYEGIVRHHPKILLKPLKNIYEEVMTWDQEDRSKLIQRILESNDIENICKREISPLTIDDIPEKLKQKVDIKKLFIDLYGQVLTGGCAREIYGDLQSHFNVLRNGPNNFLKCPACGLESLKTWAEDRNQYDHYLHKSKYITLSVNFKNLVPICTECNSYSVKHDRDILEENGTRKIFYPYDEAHQGITISATIIDDSVGLDTLECEFYYSTVDDRDEEIESWRNIFKIDSRYKCRTKGAIAKWYGHYFEFINKPYFNYSDDQKQEIYFDCQDEGTMEVIRVPVLKALRGSNLRDAESEMDKYSMFGNG